MKSFLLAPMFLTVVAVDCNKSNNVPSCINKKIAELKAQPKQNPPAEINEYIYQGQKVYLFSAPCCDQYNLLYDENCNVICAPSGGITGKGDGKCMDFSSSAQFTRLVWKDDR